MNSMLGSVAVFGAGGVGGYFGGLLAHAGHDVAFLARGEHLRAIQSNGLAVRSVHGDFAVRPARAAEDPSEIGPVDYLVVAVKNHQLAEAAAQMNQLVGPGTTVVPLLNGVEAHTRLIEALGSESVIGGLCSLVVMIEAPGVIRQTSPLRRVVLGELDRTPSERVERLVQAWADCGVEAVHAEDIHRAMWEKFLFIASFGGVASLARATAGEVLASAETRALFLDAMREVAAVAGARGVELDPEVVERTLVMVEGFGPEATSSMQRDVAAGAPFELEAFSGAVVRLGAASGVDTPVHRSLDALLRPALLKALAQRRGT